MAVTGEGVGHYSHNIIFFFSPHHLNTMLFQLLSIFIASSQKNKVFTAIISVKNFYAFFSISWNIFDQNLINTMLKNARRRYTHSCIGCRCSSSNINPFLFRRFFHALMFSILFEPATLSYFSLSSHIISRHCSKFVFFIASLQKC